MENISASTSGTGEAAEPSTEVPDDVLFSVFAWLDWRDLLRGPRAACRQWRRVALDPFLWSALSISVSGDEDEDDIAAVSSALRLSPCLKSLTLKQDVETPLPEPVVSAARGTSCAVRKLVYINAFIETPTAKLEDFKVILRRQMDLKQLKSVMLDCKYPPPSLTPFVNIVELIATALRAGLTELEVDVVTLPDNPFRPEMPAVFVGIPEDAASLEKFDRRFPNTPPDGFPEDATSLEVFRFDSCFPDPLMEDLMAPHTSTLEVVKLRGEATSRAVELVCRCPRPRAVHLPCVSAAAGLSACPLLTDISLTVRDPVPEIFPFFQNARGITRLSLTHVSNTSFGYEQRSSLVTFTKHRAAFTMSLITELGSTLLKELRIGRVSEYADPTTMLDLPLSVFSRFPLLGSLHLGNVLPAYVMDDITPSVAPNLRLLSLVDVSWEEVDCMRAECCYPALFRLVRRNPRLHVTGIPAKHGCAYGPCQCCGGSKHKVSSSKLDFDEMRQDIERSAGRRISCLPMQTEEEKNYAAAAARNGAWLVNEREQRQAHTRERLEYRNRFRFRDVPSASRGSSASCTSSANMAGSSSSASSANTAGSSSSVVCANSANMAGSSSSANMAASSCSATSANMAGSSCSASSANMVRRSSSASIPGIVPHCSLYGHGEKAACGVASHFYDRPGKCPRQDCGRCAHEWRLVR